jgi:uncharacterized protein
MIVRRRSTAALCVLYFGASGCSSPPSRFYTLSAAAAPTEAPLAVSIAVGPVTIPAAVDSPRIMLSVAQNELRPDDFSRWAAPLQEDISRTVARDLAIALGTDRVTLWTNTAAPVADCRVAIEVERFESVLGKSATVEAGWVVRCGQSGALQAGHTVAHEDAGGDVRTLAAAHSRAIARLSSDVATAVRALRGPGG